jgi:hypothetical protein
MMRKILLSLAILLSVAALAQTEKGSVLAGGGLALKTGENSSQFSFTPTVGIFAANNFVLGGTLKIDNSKRGEVKTSVVGGGPFARYYFGKTSTKPFVVTEFNFVSSTSKAPNTEDIKTNGTDFLFGMGFAAFVNETVAVEGISGYSYSKYKDADGSGGFTLRFGFGLYFNRSSAKDLKTNVIGN